MANPLKGSAGPVVAVIVVIAAAVAVYFSVFKKDDRSNLVDMNRFRWFVDAKGNSFLHEIRIGEGAPTSPSGEPAFLAELCHWTKDGKVRPTPFPVLLNQYIGVKDPTFCPDCDRLVVGQNPAPSGDPPTPPPTRAEFNAKR